LKPAGLSFGPFIPLVKAPWRPAPLSRLWTSSVRSSKGS
jgi:hypothetical protein